MFTVLNMKSENFGENLKIHAGGDDKQRIQFASPYGTSIEQESVHTGMHAGPLQVVSDKMDPLIIVL